MPTYKHPCPQCDTFIERTDDRCPSCGFQRPFAPDAPARVVRRATIAAAPPSSTAPTAAAPTDSACAGCGAALGPGARFCTECGTLVGQ